jgi:phospholipid/cholesterol/gamma-HCH transport system substrate-binding protein
MARTNDEIKVGVVVAFAALLFLVALVFVGGFSMFGKKKVDYIAVFKFAGGLEPGSIVRFGGLKVGTVESATLDPADTSRIRITLKVAPSTPVRTDSTARISSLGFLGENYLEISAGTRDAPRLPPGSTIPSTEIVQLDEVFNNVNNITVSASKLVSDLDSRVLVLSKNANDLIGSMNGWVSPENKEHFNSILVNVDTMLKQTRPELERTLANVDAASTKMAPTIDNVNVTLGKANTLADHLDSVVQQNRDQIHTTLLNLQASVQQAQRLINDLDDVVGSNQANLAETLENIRVVSQNLREFSETIKERPFSLVRIKTEKDRVPPSGGQ